MNKILTFMTSAAFACIALADGMETGIVLDISRRNTSISLSFTECCDHDVRAVVRRGGDDYALAGNEINLVIGGTSSGCIYEGIITNVNEVMFHCDAASMPTNGKYTVQIMAMKNRVSSEWGRGTLRVKANPGMDYMPSCWMGYEKVARLAASLIALDLMTNEFWTAISTSVCMNASITVEPKTNLCVRVRKSFVDEIPASTFFAWDGSNDVNMVLRNAAFPGTYMTLTTNGGFMASHFYLSGTNGVESFNPCLINSKTWFRSAASTNRKFMVRGEYCTDLKYREYLTGEVEE